MTPRRHLAALAAVLALTWCAAPAPAEAQRIVVPAAAAGAGTVANPDLAYETQGVNASTGAGTTVTGGAAVNSTGSCTSIGGAWANNISNLDIEVGANNGSSNRTLFRISTDGGTTYRTPWFYVATGTTNGFRPLSIPLKVTAGQTVCIQLQGSAANTSEAFVITGTIASAGAFPGFDNAEAIHAADASTTRAGTSAVTLRTTSTTFDTLNASTSRAYGAVLFMVSDNGTAPTAQQVRATFAVGAASSEVPIGGTQLQPAASGLLLPRGASQLFRKTISAGSRISANLQAASAGAPDQFFVDAVGFY